MENDVKKLQIKAVIGIVIVIFVYVIFTIFSGCRKKSFQIFQML